MPCAHRFNAIATVRVPASSSGVSGTPRGTQFVAVTLAEFGNHLLFGDGRWARSNWLQEEQSAPEIRKLECKLGEPKLGERHEIFRKPGATPGNTGASGST